MSAVPVHAIALRRRSAALLVVVSALGLLAYFWPLLLEPSKSANEHLAHAADAPWVFAALLPLLLGVVLAELSEGSLDAKAVAMLGVLAACGAMLRLPSGGATGFEPMFFLLIPSGRVLGRGFGFVLGALTMFASALLTGGVGPWLPFQMMAAAWVGMGAGFLPRGTRGRREIGMLVAYGIVASYLYGLVTNMMGWPFLVGISVPGQPAGLSFVPGAPVWDNLQRFAIYTFWTSWTSVDTMRAICTTLGLILLGPAVLTTLRRAAKRAQIVSVP